MLRLCDDLVVNRTVLSRADFERQSFGSIKFIVVVISRCIKLVNHFRCKILFALRLPVRGIMILTTRKIVKTPMLFHLIPKKVQAVSMAGLRVSPEEFLLLITPPQQQKGFDKAALHLLWLSIHKGTASSLQKIGRPRIDFHFSKKLT